jgi:hypothetical protein
LGQNEERLLAGSRWRKTGIVFTSSIGTPLDERNVRREFYAFLKAANPLASESTICATAAPRFCSLPANIRKLCKRCWAIQSVRA